MVGNLKKKSNNPEGNDELIKLSPCLPQERFLFLKGRSLPMRDDFETYEIGRLIDAGHPELAARVFRARWRYRWLTRAVITIPFVGAAVWHLVH